MRALILAAGQGTRLRPLTSDRPKCMVPFLGQPLVHYQLSVLRACGIDDITFVTGYRSDVIEQLGFSCVHNDRYASTNMVASMFTAEECFDGQDDLIICYSDIVYERGLLEVLLEHEGPVATVIDVDRWHALWSLRMGDPLADLETVKFRDDGTLQELGKKPGSFDEIEGQFVGLVKVARESQEKLLQFYSAMHRNVSYDGQSFENMYMTSFLQALIDSGVQVFGARSQAGWLEIDSTSDLEAYEQLERAGELGDYWQREAE